MPFFGFSAGFVVVTEFDSVVSPLVVVVFAVVVTDSDVVCSDSTLLQSATTHSLNFPQISSSK